MPVNVKGMAIPLVTLSNAAAATMAGKEADIYIPCPMCEAEMVVESDLSVDTFDEFYFRCPKCAHCVSRVRTLYQF